MDASLNFHHLRYFWVTAREGSVTRAAAKLRVTQPTVSEQLRGLEETLGERLLKREGRGFALTDVGRTVLRFVDEIFPLVLQPPKVSASIPPAEPSEDSAAAL